MPLSSPGSIALVYPPLWYYTSVPADLSHTAGFLRAKGLDVTLLDLSAKLSQDLLGHVPAFKALQDPATYADPATRDVGMGQIQAACKRISQQHRVPYAVRSLSFPDIDEASVHSARRIGLDPARNPALPTLSQAAIHLAASNPDAIAITLVYPDQRVHALCLARLLRQHGYTGALVLYGSLQDEIAPEDFTDDFLSARKHAAFDDFDGAFLGEAETGLWRLVQALTDPDAEGDGTVPNLFWADAPERPVRFTEDLSTHPPASFAGIQADWYCTPTPVADVRLGRGCPWGKCAFCAIQAHHPGYRVSSVDRLVASMADAHQHLGSTYFRIRDDLITPKQLRQISEAVRILPFDARWTARARFQPGFTADLLRDAASAGLDELWMGLESANNEVRTRMQKGVRHDVVERVLRDANAAGVRVRALCMVGFPGETLDQANQTVDFILSHLDVLHSASLSPFMLMRRSPMALAPKTHGLVLQPDTLPAWARLRFTQPASWDTLSKTELDALTRRVMDQLAPRLTAQLCPDAAHGWLRENSSAG